MEWDWNSPSKEGLLPEEEVVLPEEPEKLILK
jgi:hypothetical protein